MSIFPVSVLRDGVLCGYQILMGAVRHRAGALIRVGDSVPVRGGLVPGGALRAVVAGIRVG